MENQDLQNIIAQDPILQEKYELRVLVSTKDNIYVYEAYNKSQSKLITLKIQAIFSLQYSYSLLQKQYNLFKILKQYPGIPKIYEKGKWLGGIYVQMQYLKKSLTYMALKTTKFKQKQASYVLSKIIRTIAAFHDIGYTLNEIYPQTFYIALNKKIYIMECYKAQPIEDESFLKIKLSKQIKSLRSINYANIRRLKGQKQTYTDDIQSAYYMVCHFYHKNLLWIHDKKISNEQGILERQSTANKCINQMGKSFSSGFRYIKNLYFKVKPNYQYLLRLYQLQKYDKSPISKSRNSISQSFTLQIDEEIRSLISMKTMKTMHSSASISQKIQTQTQKEVVQIKKVCQLTDNSISAIVINKVSKKTISTQQTTNKYLYSLLDIVPNSHKNRKSDQIYQLTFDDGAGFENQQQQYQNFCQFNLDFDIEPPKIPRMHSFEINNNPLCQYQSIKILKN